MDMLATIAGRCGWTRKDAAANISVSMVVAAEVSIPQNYLLRLLQLSTSRRADRRWTSGVLGPSSPAHHLVRYIGNLSIGT